MHRHGFSYGKLLAQSCCFAKVLLRLRVLVMSVKNCLKLNPAKPIIPAVPVTPLTLPAVSPETPLKATSPPGSFSEKPEFIVIVTVTWLAPVSLIATVPTDPEIPRLFEVRSKLTEFAHAEDTHRKKTLTAKTDFAT